MHRSNQEEVAKIVLTKEENGIAQAVKAVHWIVSEDLPLSKYGSFMSLMAEYEVTDVDKLKVSESASYTSRYTANDILVIINNVLSEVTAVLIHFFLLLSMSHYFF